MGTRRPGRAAAPTAPREAGGGRIPARATIYHKRGRGAQVAAPSGPAGPDGPGAATDHAIERLKQAAGARRAPPRRSRRGRSPKGGRGAERRARARPSPAARPFQYRCQAGPPGAVAEKGRRGDRRRSRRRAGRRRAASGDPRAYRRSPEAQRRGKPPRVPPDGPKAGVGAGPRRPLQPSDDRPPPNGARFCVRRAAGQGGPWCCV